MNYINWNKYPETRPDDIYDYYLIVNKDGNVLAVEYSVSENRFYTTEYGECCINKFYEEYIEDKDILYWVAFADIPVPI